MGSGPPDSHELALVLSDRMRTGTTSAERSPSEVRVNALLGICLSFASSHVYSTPTLTPTGAETGVTTA